MSGRNTGEKVFAQQGICSGVVRLLLSLFQRFGFLSFPLYLDSFHPSKSQVGLIMGIHSVTAILVRPLFGRVLDRRGGRIVAAGRY